MFHSLKIKKGFLTTLVLLLCVALLASLVGCGGGSGKDKKDEVGQAAPSGDKPLVVFAQKSLGYYFFVAEQESLKRAVEAKGWRFESAVADFDSAKQTNQFINFIAKKPIAILSDPIDSEGLITAVDKAAKENNIPVGIVDTPTTGGKVAITVAFDNKLAGEMAAKEIVKRLEQKYGEPKGIVLNAYGAMSSWAWRLRKEGFDEVMKQYPNIKYLAMPGEGDMTKTHDALVNALAQYPNLDAVHAPSDTPALGLFEALKQKNKLFKVGEKGHVIFVTIDSEPVAHQKIKEGWYDASINQDAVSYGQIAIELMEKHTLKGQDIPLGKYTNDKYYWKEAEIKSSPSGPYLIIPPFVVDKSNVDDPRMWGNITFNEWGLKYN